MGNKKSIILLVVSVILLANLVSAVCPSGIVAYWKLDENSGTNIGDSSPSGSHNGIRNGASWTNGKLSFALDFDGVNDYVEVANSADLNPTPGITIEAWINPSSTNNDVAAVVKKTDGPLNGYTIEGSSHATGSKNTFRFIILNGDGATCPPNNVLKLPAGSCATGSTPLLSAGTWHHLVGTYDGSFLRLYLNGAEVPGSQWALSGAVVPSSNSLMIGKDPSNPADLPRFFKGRIDEVAIYSRALTLGEISQHYNADTGRDYCACECISGLCCDGCLYRPNTYECGSATLPCDVAEYCDGMGADCPPDSVQPNTFECGPKLGDCDIVEFCDGVNKDCQADVKSTAECRGSAGLCDIAEVCDGINNDCPFDNYLGAGTVCRPAASSCDIVEVCDGASPFCPADIADFFIQRNAGVDSTLTSEPADNACCDENSDCVSSSTCYNTGDLLAGMDYCDGAVWLGGDGAEAACDAISGMGNWHPGINFESGLNGNCCADDVNENLRSCQDAYGGTYCGMTQPDACCDLVDDCVFDGDCYEKYNEIDPKSSGNSFTDLSGKVDPLSDDSPDYEVCAAAGWVDPDYMPDACKALGSLGIESKWMNEPDRVCGKEEAGLGDCDDSPNQHPSYPNEFCCGDDPNEFFRAGFDNICFAYKDEGCYWNGQYYDEEEWIDDNYCQHGVMTSRTKLVALQLLNISNDKSVDDYVLFCDSYENAVNYYGYEVGIPPAPVTQVLIEANNICVLKMPDQVIFGAALNRPINEGQFIDVLEGIDNCFNAISFNDGKYHRCQSGSTNAWYNNKTQSIIYSKEDMYNLPDQFEVGLWEAFLTFLKNPFQVIFNFLIALFRDEPYGPPGQYEFINSTARFSRLYLNEKYGNSIRGVAETRPDGGEYISVAYSGYGSDICTTVNMTNEVFRLKTHTEKRFAVCRYDPTTRTYHVASNASVGIALWPELTAKLRAKVEFIPEQYCEVRSSCVAGEAAILYLSDNKDAHASRVAGGFNPRLCCPDTYELDASCQAGVVKLSDAEDAHASVFGLSSYVTVFTEDVCVRAANSGEIASCSVVEYPGNCYSDEVCFVSLSALEDAHLSRCEDTRFRVKICCKIT